MTIKKILDWEIEQSGTVVGLITSLRRLCAVATDESRLAEIDVEERNQVLDAAAWIKVILIGAILTEGKVSDCGTNPVYVFTVDSGIDPSKEGRTR